STRLNGRDPAYSRAPRYTARSGSIGIIYFDTGVCRNDPGCFRAVFLRDHAGATIRKDLVDFAWSGRGREIHPDRDRAVIGPQAKWSLQAGLLEAGKREETDDGFVVGSGAAVPRADHIPVCLTGEVLSPVVRKNELDQADRLPDRTHRGVLRDLLTVMIP